jgi:rhamnopyranosyl-N-acetylglucosaminyl-diphospho-decaprenol beta-1,3/1,4-galactofuranosyltransferase
MNYEVNPMTKSIAAIVVTHNRLKLLQECIDSIRNQSYKPTEIIVINNNSSDGTKEWLDQQSDLRVVHQANLGGAGGFHRGIREAYTLGYDWFWCMDDDTIPQRDALHSLALSPHFANSSNIGYLSSLVKWTDGSIHYMNMHPPSKAVDWYGTVLESKCVSTITSSFVSILINRDAVTAVGLPIKEFFIWQDDVEYTQRISKKFKNYCVLDSIVIHKTPTNSTASSAIDPTYYRKKCYGLRNKVATLKLLDDNIISKSIKIASFLAKNSFYIFKNKSPLYLLLWMYSGLFFTVRIEMIRSSKNQSFREIAT